MVWHHSTQNPSIKIEKNTNICFILSFGDIMIIDVIIFIMKLASHTQNS